MRYAIISALAIASITQGAFAAATPCPSNWTDGFKKKVLKLKPGGKEYVNLEQGDRLSGTGNNATVEAQTPGSNNTFPQYVSNANGGLDMICKLEVGTKSVVYKLIPDNRNYVSSDAPSSAPSSTARSMTRQQAYDLAKTTMEHNMVITLAAITKCHQEPGKCTDDQLKKFNSTSDTIESFLSGLEKERSSYLSSGRSATMEAWLRQHPEVNVK